MLNDCAADWLHETDVLLEDTLWVLRCVSATTFEPEPLSCCTVATCVPDVVARVSTSSSLTSSLFVPETFVCVTVQLWVTPDTSPEILHAATLFAVVADCTITHVFGGLVPLPAGVQENELTPGPAAICTTCCAVVQFQS